MEKTDAASRSQHTDPFDVPGHLDLSGSSQPRTPRPRTIEELLAAFPASNSPVASNKAGAEYSERQKHAEALLTELQAGQRRHLEEQQELHRQHRQQADAAEALLRTPADDSDEPRARVHTSDIGELNVEAYSDDGFVQYEYDDDEGSDGEGNVSTHTTV